MTGLGIDYGTTNSTVALHGQSLSHFDGGDQRPTLPSVVAHLPTGAVLVGAQAKRRRVIDPKNTIVSPKRLMGQGIHSYATVKYREHYPVDVTDVGDGVAFVTRAGSQRPEEIAATVLERLLSAVQLSAPGTRAAITVPSQFDDAAREATRAAGWLAGMREVELVEEPVATAMAYLVAESPQLGLAAVYDLGGGTFDLSIVDCAATPFRVLARGGDAYLGGDDIDLAIARSIRERVLRESGWDLGSDREVFDRLLVEAEKAKVALSNRESSTLWLSAIDPAASGAMTSLDITRSELEEVASTLVRRTFVICDQVLHEARVKARDVDAIFLAGGSTRIPSVQREVERFFGRPARSDIDPLSVVSVGASLMRRR